MSKSNKKNKPNKKPLPTVVPKVEAAILPFWAQPRWHMFFLFGLSLLLYANTLGHDYAQDDAIVIYDNMFTKEGLSGIPGILKNDTFYGFFKEAGKAQLVSGGRYRPFTLMMFAVEWQLFGENPFIGHLISVLLYGLLGIMIYKMLTVLMLPDKDAHNSNYAALGILMTSLLFVAHPIHTEVTANIKGRDEIMSMLGAVTALWAILKNVNKPDLKWQLVALFSFFVALMSKENAITFLGIIPLALLFFKKLSLSNIFKSLWPLMVSTVLFLIIRTAILGFDLGSESMELMNNPFLKLTEGRWVPFTGGEKVATILYTLGKYLTLLIFPHPLSHDYYPRAIDIMTMGDWRVILSLVIHLALIVVAVYLWKKDRVISFGIFFYLISLSIVSNIVFPIGTNMSERFLFMPSLGFAMVLTRVLSKFLNQQRLFVLVTGIIVVAFATKTVLRNPVWKNDYTLFTTDVKTNQRSAKLLNAAGGALSTRSTQLDDGSQKTKMLDEAISYLNKAVEIHPTYKNAYLLLGNSYYYQKKFDPAIQNMEKALRLDPNFKDAQRNLPIILRDAGKYYGQAMNQLDKSQSYLERSYKLNPTDFETARLLGIVNGMQGKHEVAISYFKKVIELQPKIAAGYVNLGTAYRNIGDEDQARVNYNKAVELDPKALNSLVEK